MHVGSQTVREVLEPWDISVTEELIEKWKLRQDEKLARAAEEQAQKLQVCILYHRNSFNF